MRRDVVSMGGAAGMDLHPSEEQQQLIDAYRALYAKESPPERVRSAEPLGFDPSLWDHLGQLGGTFATALFS